jgi:hypothetical protein
LRTVEFDPDEDRILAGFGLLTKKPVLILFNLGEGGEPPEIEYPYAQSALTSIQGQLEMEIAQLPADEIGVYLEEYGISDPGLDRILNLSYELMGLISFYTIGDDEVRAWTIAHGGTAHQGAGLIHSDLYKGFIRAEIIAWDELVALGGLPAARTAGKLRLEGKDYVLQDGEVMQVRFNL